MAKKPTVKKKSAKKPKDAPLLDQGKPSGESPPAPKGPAEADHDEDPSFDADDETIDPDDKLNDSPEDER
jgi:hypothetical protein